MTRWLGAALALGLAGCTCGGQVEDCDNTLIVFDAPQDGSSVAAPTDVVVSVTDKAGTAVELASATLSTRLQSATEFSAPLDGTLETGKATFGGVAMSPGTNYVRVAVQKANSSCSPLAKTIAVNVTTNTCAPEVTAFKFEGDANDDGSLNSSEFVANQPAINAQLTFGSCAVGCKVVVNYGQAVMGEADITGASVTVSMAAAKFANLMNAQYPLGANVVCPDGRRNDPTVNTVSRRTLTLDREAPTCSILSPSKTLYGPSDDDDAATAGYQVRTLGQAGSGAATIELKLNGGATPQTTGPQSASGGTLARDFTIPSAGDTAYSVVLEVRDAAGNLCTVAKQVQADFVAPGVTITAPTAGNQTSYNLPVTIAVTGGDGATVVVTTTPSGGSAQAVCGGTVASGAFTCNGSFPAGAQTVTVTVTDAAGNTATQTVNINVSAPGCAIAFTQPPSNPALLTPRQDLQSGVPDLQYQFVAVSPTSGCGSKVTRLYRNGTLVDTGATDSGGQYRSPTRTEADSAGATITYRVEIDDGIGNTTAASVSVVVNLNIPVITLPVNNSSLNTERDLDSATAGIQAQLTYAPAPPSGFKGVLCSSVNLGGGVACLDGAGGFIVPGGDGIPTASAAFTYPDGAYALRMVFKELAGSQTVSDPAAVTNIQVESVRPVVTAFTFQGDANNDKRLNAAEQASGDPVAVLAITGANGGTVVVRNRATSAIVSGSPVAVSSTGANVALPGLGASGGSFEGDFADLVAEVTTVLGSKNMVVTPPPSGATLNAVAFTALRVDRAAPGCTMTSPSAAQLGLADDADGATGGYQVRVAGSTAADVGANGVTLELAPTSGAAQTQMVTPASQVVAHNFTVPGTGETDYEARCTATDASGNVGVRATRSVRVDLLAPGCTLVTPNAGSSPYTSSYVISTQVTVTDGNGLIPTVFSAVGSGPEQQVGQLPAVSGGTSTGNVTYPSGAQTVRVEVTDAAGNRCTGSSTQQTITVNVPGCSLTWTAPVGNPARLLRVDDSAPASPTTAEYTLTGTTSCPSQQIRFYRGSVSSANEMSGSPTTTNGSGGFSFPISLPDSDGVTQETIIAELNNGNLTSFPLGIYVDLTVPQVTNATPTGANLSFVSGSNSRLGTAGYVVDTEPGTLGAQFSVSVTTTGAVGGTLSVRYQGSEIAGPATISGATTGIDPVTLPHNSTGTFVIRVMDASGNIVDTTSSAAVDVIAPAATTVTCTLVAGKEREARVNAAWTTTYDDGSDGSSGAVSKYDVRWTSEVVAAGGLTTSADYFDSNKAWSDALVDPPTLSREVLVPPLVSTYCYVRARDELFNYSPFPATLPPAVANAGQRYTLSNPHASAAAGQEFGRFMAARGSLNNDAIDDMAMGFGYFQTTGNPERVFIYYGASTGFASQTPQEVTAPDGLAGAFGFDVSMGNVGDATVGDNKSDLLVASPLASSSAGRVYLFFGTTGAAQINTALANTIIFLGNPATSIGRAAQIIGDTNADGLGEILIAAPNEDGNKGRAYLFYGRSIAAWQALSGGNPIPMSAADRVFLGPTPLPVGQTTNDFGRLRGGYTNIGTDFAFPASRTTIASVFIFDGASVGAAAAGTTYTTGFAPGTPNQSMQTLVGTVGGSGTREGFGTRVLANLDLVSTANPDLVVTEPIYRKVHLFADRMAGMFPSVPTTTINGPVGATFFGNDAAALDYTGDGRPDLVIGDNTPGGWAYVLPNRGLAGSEFETLPGAVGGFWYARLAGSKLGQGMCTGDFDGDTKPDFAVSDVSDGTGKVFVWH